jgi:hypothetical protein
MNDDVQDKDLNRGARAHERARSSRDDNGAALTTVEPILQFFDYEHLPKDLADVSEPFCMLALDIVENLPRNPERTVALRKLLEAKDCAVRAKLMRPSA